jgi:hypothetical protein
VGEATGDLPGPPDGRFRGRHDALVKNRKALPGDGCLEGLAEQAHGHEQIPQIGCAEEGLTPGASSVDIAARTTPGFADASVLALSAVTASGVSPTTAIPHVPTMIPAQLERPLHGGVDGVIGGLEAEQEQRTGAVAGERQARLGGVDETAVGRVQARL